jgi:hypothetical protein
MNGRMSRMVFCSSSTCRGARSRRLVLVVGGVVCELMHQGHQEGVLVQVAVHAYPVRQGARGTAVVPELGGARWRSAPAPVATQPVHHHGPGRGGQVPAQQFRVVRRRHGADQCIQAGMVLARKVRERPCPAGSVGQISMHRPFAGHLMVVPFGAVAAFFPLVFRRLDCCMPITG